MEVSRCDVSLPPYAFSQCRCQSESEVSQKLPIFRCTSTAVHLPDFCPSGATAHDAIVHAEFGIRRHRCADAAHPQQEPHDNVP